LSTSAFRPHSPLSSVQFTNFRIPISEFIAGSAADNNQIIKFSIGHIDSPVSGSYRWFDQQIIICFVITILPVISPLDKMLSVITFLPNNDP